MLAKSIRYIASRQQALDSSAEHVNNIEISKDKNTNVDEVKFDLPSTNLGAIVEPDIINKKKCISLVSHHILGVMSQ
jgi:hypothetical protein